MASIVTDNNDNNNNSNDTINLRKQLTQELKKRRLNTLGFIWDPITFVWETYFKALKQFKEKNGKHQWPPQIYEHTIIYKDGKKEIIKLGVWCDTQRQAKKGNRRGNLTEKQICRLNCIDFIWEPSARVT